MSKPDLAIFDSLRVTRALIHRLQAEFIGWGRREGNGAPPAAQALARLALGIATTMLVELEQLEALQSAGIDPDIESIVSLNQRAKAAEHLHSYLEASTHRTLHPVLSPTVRTELESLHVEGEVLVCGTRDMSYEIQKLRREYFDKLVAAEDLNAVTWPLLIFRVPNAPLDWPLNHVLLYHEIGHALVKPDSLPTPSLPSDLDPNQASDLVKRMERGVAGAMYRRVLASWFEEIYADAVGVVLAGPAYFWAFCRILGGFFPLDQATETHPPTGLRVRFIGMALKDAGFYDILSDGMRALVDAWLQRSETVHIKKYKGSEKLGKILIYLVRAAEDNRVTILNKARTASGSRAYSIDWFRDDQVRGTILSSLQIPPIEANELPSLDGPGIPLPPARIFGSTWAGYLEETDLSTPVEQIASRSEYFAHVLLGSLDGAEALRAWLKVP